MQDAGTPNVRIIATGLYTPPNTITNEELAASFNEYVERYNEDNAAEIAAEKLTALQPSSAEFIEKASGIKARHVIDKEGILDIERMRPMIPARSNDELSILAEMAVYAAKQALASADLKASDIDGVICAASNLQRGYPAVAIEVQEALGINGYGFDMNVACASASFGIKAGAGLIAGGARRVLMVNPEICTAHLNFRDRDSHFIFGDVATALILEANDTAPQGEAYDIIGAELKTQFSNNIRNNFGFLNRCERETDEPADDQTSPHTDKLFQQNGRKVFKEVSGIVSAMITEHLSSLSLNPDDIKRFWLHQANLGMNDIIIRKVLGREPSREEAPVVLDEYANTSSAGSIIAFHKHRDGLEPGDLGMIAGFGAGYSAGCVTIRRSA